MTKILIEREAVKMAMQHVPFMGETYKALRDALAVGDACGWLRAVDEAMVCSHLGVADPADDYLTAKDKLNQLLVYWQDIGEYFAREGGTALTKPEDGWQEEARRYCANAEYWRERAEKAEALIAAQNEKPPA